MSLYDRLLGMPGFVKIPVHAFMSALGEVERGKISGAQVTSAFNLTAGEAADASTLIGRVVVPEEVIGLGGFVTLTNVGAAYDTITAAQGLGIFRIQTAGVSVMELTVFVNKIGTGTQSWQLWDVTNAAEITVINDAGAAGAKVLTATRTFSPVLGIGAVTYRLRTRSTNAADDPLYLGGSVRIRRTENLRSSEVHELLLLAESGVAYNTEAALRSRLGT